MKSTFNPKYAIYAFFLIEILSSLAFILTRYSFSNFIVLFSNIATASICLYFVCLKNEYITTVKQKIALCYLGIYNLLREGTIFTLLPIPNKEEYFTFYTTIESIALISHFIAFLVIIWQFSIKKVYKQWLSALYFLPIIFFSIIWMIISIIMVNKDLTRIEYILEFIITWHISYIITYSLMLWLILKAHKQKNEIE
jgi:hypothetical protein